MLNLFDVKYNIIYNTYVKHKKMVSQESAAETIQTNILILYRVSSLYHSLFSVYI